jgi:hypothetical protein
MPTRAGVFILGWTGGAMGWVGADASKQWPGLGAQPASMPGTVGADASTAIA